MTHPIDADGHVMEPDEIWPRFLEPSLHPMAPRRVWDSQGRMRHLIGGQLLAEQREKELSPLEPHRFEHGGPVQ